MGKFLFPLNNGAYEINNSERIHGAKTYNDGQPHGLGKLDLKASPGDEVRSMTNGKVLKAGKDNTTDFTSCDILVNGDYWKPDGVDGLVIRYYHIVDFPFKVGDIVNQGDIIGYVDYEQLGAQGAHLHLDFCSYINGGYSTLMQGKLSYEQLTDEQKSAIALWQSQHGIPGWGRCWEVIATSATYQEESTIEVEDLHFSSDSFKEPYIATLLQKELNKKLSDTSNMTNILAGILGNMYVETGTTFDPFIPNGQGYYGLYQTNNSTFIREMKEKFGSNCFSTRPSDEVTVKAAIDFTIDFLFNRVGLNANTPAAEARYYEWAVKKGSSVSGSYTDAEYQAEIFQIIAEKGVGGGGNTSIITPGGIEVFNLSYPSSPGLINQWQMMPQRRNAAKNYITGEWR